MKSALLNRLALFLASVGVFIAGTLTLAEITDKDVPCGGGSGCAVVAADVSSHFLGFPTALIGVAGYVALFLLSIWRLRTRPTPFQSSLGLVLAGIGTMASAGLTSYSVFNLHTTCLWCLGSAATMALSLAVQFLLTKPQVSEPSSPRVDWLWAVGLATLSLGGIFIQAKFFKHEISLKLTRELARKIDIDQLIPIDAKSRGPQTAPITIVEFADFACPACRALYPRIAKLMEHNPTKIRLVFHHLPFPELEGHQDSQQAAVLSEYAKTADRFWEFADLVYASASTPKLAQYESILSRVAPGVKKDQKAAEARVKADVSLAARLRIGQTPTFVLVAEGLPKEVATSQNLKDILSSPAYTNLLAQP